MPKSRLNHFWITNISNKIVSLSDLVLHIQPFTSMNLLDAKHHHYTEDQLLKSKSSGSIFNKRNKVVVRDFPPNGIKKPLIPIQEDAVFASRSHSAIEVEDIKYEELSVSDDDFASDNAETAAQDHLGKWADKK